MDTRKKIAVVGLSCRYPDADNPLQLWENILSRRRAFRHIPEKRLNNNYFSEDSSSPDYIYSSTAALLKNYQFDRNRFNVSKNNFRTADLAHWLALDVADEALKDAQLVNLSSEVREKTGVIIGNTLTGEQTRTNLLRLRWPYVASSVSSSLKQQNWESDKIAELLNVIETNFKKPFPEMEEDSLAGGLSNTIAGRICNYFDFKGGGFTIDGACSSSLLAIAKACDAIANKDLLLALAGGVDISLDPFELVGFSRAGALAKKEMLVYDSTSNGFWPGEGCGFVVLADYDFAKENNLNILALIKGWGISSDGKGGLTRPEINGQYLALKRAYEKANYGIDTVTYIEGHGTGTQAGDMAELSAVLKLIAEKETKSPVYIGSVKANIGHTKAAAGIAGFIKTVLVLKNRIVPAITGNINPHNLFQQQKNLKLPSFDIAYKATAPMRVGVSSMGFGGINTHITIEENYNSSTVSAKQNNSLSSTLQDTELFMFAEPDLRSLKKKLHLLHKKAKQLSRAEMTDISCTLYQQLQPHPYRVAIEAATPEVLHQKIEKLLLLVDEKDEVLDIDTGIYFSTHQKGLRIGLLFPGQGNDVLLPDGLLTQRFPLLDPFIPGFLKNGFEKEQLLHTNIAQPAIVATSLVAVKLLEKMGIQSSVALGHSVGEVAALSWAGMLNTEDAMQLTTYRGKMMHESAGVKGNMVSVRINYHDPVLEQIIKETGASVACINSPSQIVLSGSKDKIEKACLSFTEKNISFALLKVENAFHSSLMKKVEAPFGDYLSGLKFSKPDKNIFSTVSGQLIGKGEDAATLLYNQLTQPVIFYKAFSEAAGLADMWIEVGAGSTLTNMVKSFSNAMVTSLDMSGKTIVGLAKVTGALFVCGHSFNHNIFFENRFYRPLRLEDEFSFIESPCEQGDDFHYEKKPVQPILEKQGTSQANNNQISAADIYHLFKDYLGEKLGLPPGSFKNEDRMLNDFHLNSLFVSQFLSEFANQYGLKITDTPMEYANASIDEVVQMFGLLNSGDNNIPVPVQEIEKKNEPEGIEAWVHGFEIIHTGLPLPMVTENRETLFSGCIACGEIPLQIKSSLPGAEAGIGNTLLVFLYHKNESAIIKTLLETTHLLKEKKNIKGIQFFQEMQLATGFAKSLFQEIYGTDISVITIGADDINAGIIIAELNAANGFREIIYKNCKRFTAELKPLTGPGNSNNILPGKNDVVLVTGGAKGITVECVRQLGKLTQCKFILTGKSAIDAEEVRENLDSIRQSNIRFDYYATDITDKSSVAQMLESIRQKDETITGIIHAAGINNPKKIFDLQEGDFTKTLAPKITGLQNILQFIDMEPVNFCISFGSVIAKTGMEGNADYALANEWLENEIEKCANLFPQTKFLNIQWSVWGGTGMGQKLGVLEALKLKGIQPVSLDAGINFFITTLKHPPLANSIIATGRYGKLTTLHHKQEVSLTAYRFIETVSVLYPGIELIAECSLSPFTDPYLQDHIVEGKMLWPAVFGMEAMVQAVSFLTKKEPGYFEIRNAEFLHPIIVENGKEKRIRIIAQRKKDTVFSVVIRDESSSFKKDHFRASVILAETIAAKKIKPLAGLPLSSLNVASDLYGTVLFHTGVFQQLSSYYEAGPYKCIAAAGGKKAARHFSDFMPQQLLLGSPVLNDAAMHAVQVCVPDKILLPVKVGSLSFYSIIHNGEINIHAEEQENHGDEYVYNIKVTSAAGLVLQEWGAVLFRAMQKRAPKELPLPLAKIALQRKVDTVTDIQNHATIYLNDIYTNNNIVKRMDGKPLVENGTLSKAYARNNTMLAEAATEISCDMEIVIQKPYSAWQSIFTSDRLQLIKKIQDETGEGFSSTATRVWCAMECIRKAGLQYSSPLLLGDMEKDNTIYLETGEYKIITCKWVIKGDGPAVFAVLLKKQHEKKI